MSDLWLVVFAALTTACGSESIAPSSSAGSPMLTAPTGPLVFRASPIEQSTIRWITPLGNLNPPDHTLPTDHIYFYFAATNLSEQLVARRTALFAPVDGAAAFTAASRIFIR